MLPLDKKYQNPFEETVSNGLYNAALGQLVRDYTASLTQEQIGSAAQTLAAQLLVRRAVDLARSGMSAAEIAEDLEKARERVHLFALVDTLK